MSDRPPASGGDLTPISATERFAFLDVLRGVAILGILPENIAYFAIPIAAADSSRWLTTEGWREPAAYYLTRVFGDYKFLTIFSLLFGVGMALIQRRCEATGRAFGALYRRRLLVLLGLSLLHAWFVWYGDILFYYACLGFIALRWSSWPVERLMRWGVRLLLVPAVILLLLAVAASMKDYMPGAVAQLMSDVAPPALPEDWRELSFNKQLEHLFLNGEVEAHVMREEGYAKALVVRLLVWAFGLPILGLYIGWRILALFLIGMAWMKQGWIATPRENAERFRRLRAWGLSSGLLIEGMGLAVELKWGETTVGGLMSECLHYLGSLGLGAGYIGVVGWLFERRPPAWTKTLAVVGRMALSNYLLQTMICTTVFYHFGLRWFGKLDRMQLWAVVAVVWIANVAFSVAWARVADQGPFEWLWRRLTYGAANRRAAA